MKYLSGLKVFAIIHLILKHLCTVRLLVPGIVWWSVVCKNVEIGERSWKAIIFVFLFAPVAKTKVGIITLGM